MEWNLGLGGKYSVYKGYFWQLSVQDESGVIQCIFDFRQPWISETAACSKSDIWAYGAKYTGYFWQLSLQGQYEVNRYISDFQQLYPEYGWS